MARKRAADRRPPAEAPAPHSHRPGAIERGRAWARFERGRAAWDAWEAGRGLIVVAPLLVWGLVRTVRGQPYGPEIATAGLLGCLWIGWLLVRDLRTGGRLRRLRRTRRERRAPRGSVDPDAEARR